MSNQIERRYFGAEVEAEEGEGEGRTIRGYAAVYNSPSEDLGGFIEIIHPGFFDGVLDQDVRALWNHNSDYVLGRTKSGTLKIESDETGLRTETMLPDTTWGRDAHTSIRRGDVDQMSFAFLVREGGDRWERRDGVNVRHLLPGGCAGLLDVSPVTYPAYQATSVSARALAMSAELSSAQTLQQADDTVAETGAGQDTDAAEREQQLQARRETARRRLELAKKRLI